MGNQTASSQKPADHCNPCIARLRNNGCFIGWLRSGSEEQIFVFRILGPFVTSFYACKPCDHCTESSITYETSHPMRRRRPAAAVCGPDLSLCRYSGETWMEVVPRYGPRGVDLPAELLAVTFVLLDAGGGCMHGCA